MVITQVSEQFQEQNEIEELEDILSKLWVDRHGDVPNSNMTTTSLELLTEPGVLYEFDGDRGILQASFDSHSKIRIFKSCNTPPSSLKYATFIGHWDDTPGTPDFTNILGGNGHLLVDTMNTKITIPLVTATEETLSYFKAHLIASGDCFRFQSKRKFPIFTMEIGKNYVPEFIMKQGNGLYLEYHNEPHFHQPMNSSSSGSYLLAKKVGVDKEGLDIFHMTAFEIPYGYAVYTEPGAIHDDATTQGTKNDNKRISSYVSSSPLSRKPSSTPTLRTLSHPFPLVPSYFLTEGIWRVAYINAHKYSTVLLCNKTHDILDIAIEQIEPIPPI